jgi:hypothetical protein
MADGATFFPWTSTPRDKSRGDPGLAIPREARKSTATILRCAPAQSPPHRASAMGTPGSGCVADRLRPSDRHRRRGGRGLETAKEK